VRGPDLKEEDFSLGRSTMKRLLIIMTLMMLLVGGALLVPHIPAGRAASTDSKGTVEINAICACPDWYNGCRCVDDTTGRWATGTKISIK
jgi:hypothetical protein